MKMPFAAARFPLSVWAAHTKDDFLPRLAIRAWPAGRRTRAKRRDDEVPVWPGVALEVPAGVMSIEGAGAQFSDDPAFAAIVREIFHSPALRQQKPVRAALN